MSKIGKFFLCVFLINVSLLAAFQITDKPIFLQKTINDWQQKSSPKIFTKATLFNHIDGGAEIFLEFGFNRLFVLNFARDSVSVVLEIYEMENPTAALGIYLLKCGTETSDLLIHGRNSGTSLQTTILKNRYFFQLNHFSGKENLQHKFADLLNPILDAIPDGSDISLVKELPPGKIIPGSIFLFRGPYALEPIFTFGDGDIFQLRGKIFGIGADYDSSAFKYTQLVIPYPDSTLASAAYDNFLLHHDTYLKIISESPQQVIFQDYQNKFGLIKKINRKILIKLHLPTEPH
jgi:hypothetical protein